MVSPFIKTPIMALTTTTQVTETLDRAKAILIALPKIWTIDAVSTALALARILERRDKKVEIVCDGFAAPESLRFLTGIERVAPEIRKLQSFTIGLNISRAKVDELSYDIVGNELRIVVTPKSGQYDARDVRTSVSSHRYDTIVALDARDYASLGDVFSRHTDFFYHRPVININHEPAGEHFGNINLIDITATSVAELVYRACKDAGSAFLNEEVATGLLAGVIAKTRSFKTENVTPKTLEMAADLVSAGARREQIVRSLYRTRSLSTLKLWGRALARLKFDPGANLATTALTRQDFVQAGADEAHLPDVIDELIANSPEAEIVCLLYESPSGEPTVCGLVSALKHADALGLVRHLKPVGDRRLARLCFPGADLIEVERTVLQSINAALGKVPAAQSHPRQVNSPTPALAP
ncbi:hypothetical protein HY633_00145 [Candidatus Uhrbacteria bacterium]|nr:hypothetical protein [Candidatus Uhrbacteria bacterium]